MTNTAKSTTFFIEYFLSLRVSFLNTHSAVTSVSSSDKGRNIQLGFRPENLILAKTDKNSFTANVSLVESLGEYALVYATVKGSFSDHNIIAKLLGTPKISKGDQVSFQIQKGKMHLFDEEGKRYVNGKQQV